MLSILWCISTTSVVEPAFSYIPSNPSVASLQTPSQISTLNMTSSNENHQYMKSITNNMAMHIHPTGPIPTNEESANTIFLEQDASCGSYSIDTPSMEGALMILNGVTSFVADAQSVLFSTSSTVMSMDQLKGCILWKSQSLQVRGG
ncbi:hypothetical protein LIER_25384 [Lithospermum erythrorhizon]|uniref:Dirigent protein n=1 Tax=Lithospermum erythrorhizon TaxID=34254 RepID=A0AAV3R7T0_LITER